jgi:hypothetical protein
MTSPECTEDAALLGGAVQHAFQTASSRLKAPSLRECEALAVGFMSYRRSLDNFVKWSAPFQPKWNRVTKVVAQSCAIESELAELAELATTYQTEDEPRLVAMLELEHAQADWK